MSDTKDKDNDPLDNEADELTARIRRERPFSLSEAVAREAGGLLKGASPVPATRQLLLAVAELLANQLPDSEGSLNRTIVARLAGDPPLLARHAPDPHAVLDAFLGTILGSEVQLEILVRQVDARWGRDYDERPRFEKGDAPPAPDDPYTLAGVRILLTELRARLSD